MIIEEMTFSRRCDVIMNIEKFLGNKPLDPEIKAYFDSEELKFGNQILTTRFKLGFTQEDTAARLGLSLLDYLKYEGGSKEFTLDDYKTILKKIEDFKAPIK